MTPYLKTDTLYLYAPYHRKPDVESHVEWLNDKDVVKYSEQRHQKHTIESQWAYLKSFDHIHNHFWEIATRREAYSRAVGTITAYTDPHNMVADVGIMVGKQFWGSGIGTVAWDAVCEWLLHSKPVRKIEAATMEPNKGMLAIFARTRFHFEGIKINHFLLNGKPTNMVQMARFE